MEGIYQYIIYGISCLVVEPETTSFVLYVEAEVMGVCGATVVTWRLFGSITLFSLVQGRW
jgi:hypothetical protein